MLIDSTATAGVALRLVVLYTDGILERPGASPASSTVELAAVVEQVFDERAEDPLDGSRLTERACEAALRQMTRSGGYGDDVTVLAARPVRPPDPLRLELPARADALGEARDRTSDWLDALDVRAIDRVGVLHATNELMSNVVSHAYARLPQPGPMRLSLHLMDSGDHAHTSTAAQGGARNSLRGGDRPRCCAST